MSPGLVTASSPADEPIGLARLVPSPDAFARANHTAPFTEAGDMTAALFFAHWRQSESIQIALELTTAAVFAVLQATADAEAREIQLISAQELIANPVRRFSAVQVR